MSEKATTAAFESLTVADFMTRGGAVLSAHATLDSAWGYFEHSDVNVLPVVDQLRLIGVLTKTDFLRAFSRRSHTSAREVRDFMTPKPKSFSPRDALRLVLEDMAITRHRSYPVVEDDRFAGTISRESVIRALHEAGLPISIGDAGHAATADRAS